MTKQSKTTRVIAGETYVQAETDDAQKEAQTKALQQDVPHGEAVELYTPTVAQVQDSVISAFAALDRAFTLEVERIRETSDQETGEVSEERTVLNRLGFHGGQLMATMVWKLEQMIAKIDEDMAVQQRKIRSALSAQRGEQVGENVDKLIDWLEVLVDQRAQLEAITAQAKDSYAVHTGREYGSKAPRKEIRLAASSPQAQRLAAMGINLRG